LYFYSRIDESPDDVFKVSITGTSKSGHCRIWTEILDRRDGSFIVRFKVYNSCTNLKIQVQYKNKQVAESPYSVPGNENKKQNKKNDYKNYVNTYLCHCETTLWVL
jgi:hypothetical protein